jgi:peptide/nickel transport system substrate-binding protein
VLVCAAMAGCGSSSAETADGGTLTGTYASFPESLDPGLSFSLEGATALQNVYIPLLTYAHANCAAGTKLIPGLAEGLPQIDQGGKRYTLFLRRGLQYSDGTPVEASDFRFVVERLFRINSAGSTFFTGIVGAEQFAKTKKGGIAGIETDDRSGKIVIHLTQPSGTFSYVLGLTYAALLPADTPSEDQTAHPPPATGPYVITDVRPGRSWEYARNPAWAAANGEAMPSLPSGHVDKIKLRVQSNPDAQLNEVEQGKVDWMKNPPPPNRYAQVKNKYEGTQFREEPTISVYYFWMNTQKPPFNDVRVRQAMRLIADRPQLVQQAFSGHGHVGNDIYSPFDEAYDTSLPQRHQDIDKAKSLLKAAGQEGLTVDLQTTAAALGMNEGAQVFAEQAKAAGVKVNVKTVDGGTFYGDQYLKWTFSTDFWNPKSYLAQVAAGSLPTSPYNETHWPDSAHQSFLSLYKQAKATPDRKKQFAILHEMQKMEYDAGGYLIWGFNNRLDGYSSKVKGLVTGYKSSLALNQFGQGFRSLWFG